MTPASGTNRRGWDVIARFRFIVLVACVALAMPRTAAYAGEAQAHLAHPNGLLAESSVQVAQSADDSNNDPLESMNRAIFGFNEGLQDYFLHPVVTFYNSTVPDTPRRAVKNMFENVKTPITFVNDVLQFEFQRALVTFMRGFINTFFGVGGMMDLAGDLGFEKHKEDFGQTLAVWGVGEGFYLVLPVFGPSNPRDAIGRLLVDPYFDPLSSYLNNIDESEVDLTLSALDGVLEYADVVEELDQIKKTSVDYYAAIRSLYRQKRKAEIANGKALDLPPIPDLAPEIHGEYLPGDSIASIKAGH